MKTVAYLAMDDMGDFVTDFDLSFEPMADLGWQVSTVPWRSDVDWDEFDAVYICTPWDYPEYLPQFLEVLQRIEASRALLINELSLVTWNLEKTYLRDVARRGGDIVPSRWYDDFGAMDPDEFFAAHETDQVVIKPTVGANAKDTFVLKRPIDQDLLQTLRRTFDQRAFLVQPFIETIRTIGEYSLFFFNGEFSYTIQKSPKDRDRLLYTSESPYDKNKCQFTGKPYTIEKLRQVRHFISGPSMCLV